MGVRPARRVRGAAVETCHALQETFTPEEREDTVRVSGERGAVAPSLQSLCSDTFFSSFRLLFVFLNLSHGAVCQDGAVMLH